MSWTIKQLADIAEIRKGSVLTKATANEDGTIPVVAGGQSAAYYHGTANRKPPVITVSASGAYAGFVNYWETPIFASDCSTIQAPDDITTKFLYIALKDRQSEVYRMQRGGGQPHVYPKDLQKILIPLPPIEQREKIVDKISVITKAEQLNSSIIAKLDELFDSLLNKNFAGQTNLLQIKDVVSVFQYGLSKPMNEEGIGYPILRINSIVDGRISGENMKYIDISPEDLKKYRVHRGDIFFNRTNSFELVGKTGLNALEGDIVFASYLVRLITNDKILPEYLNYFLNSSRGQAEIKRRAKRAVSQANVNAKELGSIILPVPDLEIQKTIVRQIVAVQKYRHSLKKREKLYRELSASIFRKFTVEDTSQVSAPARAKKTREQWFAIKQGIGAVLERLAQTPYERGEMVIAKYMYFLQEIYKVPFGLNFVRHQFGPYDPDIKKAIISSAFNKDKFFKVKGTGEYQVYSLGSNADTLMVKYPSDLLISSKQALDDLTKYTAKAPSRDIERLASVCKLAQDLQAIDSQAIKAGMAEWKPGKFTENEIEKSLAFIRASGWYKAILGSTD